MSELLLSRELYALHAIRFACQQFSGICSVTVHEQADGFLCRFQPGTVQDTEQIAKEFENYLIDYLCTEYRHALD